MMTIIGSPVVGCCAHNRATPMAVHLLNQVCLTVRDTRVAQEPRIGLSGLSGYVRLGRDPLRSPILTQASDRPREYYILADLHSCRISALPRVLLVSRDKLYQFESSQGRRSSESMIKVVKLAVRGLG